MSSSLLGNLVTDIQAGFASGERLETGGVVQVRMNNVETDGSWNWHSERRVPASQKQLDRCRLLPGDVLFNCTNSPELVGKSALFLGKDEDTVFSNHFFRLKVDHSRLEPAYLTRWLQMKWRQGDFKGMCNAWVNQASVRKEDLLALSIPLPPLETQKHIARVLEQADQLRKQAQQMESELNQLAQSLFLEMFGDYRKQGDDKFVPLSSVADVVSGVAKGSALKGKTRVVPYLRVANVQDGFLDLSEIKEIEATERDIEKYTLRAGDILMTEGGDHDKLGRGAMWSDEIQECIHQNHIFRVRLGDSYEPKFFEYYLRTPMVKTYFLRCAKKTTNLASINMTQLKGLPTPVETIEKQKKFVSALRKIEDQLELVINQKRGLEDGFQSLMQRAFKGELTPKANIRAA